MIICVPICLRVCLQICSRGSQGSCTLLCIELSYTLFTNIFSVLFVLCYNVAFLSCICLFIYSSIYKCSRGLQTAMQLVWEHIQTTVHFIHHIVVCVCVNATEPLGVCALYVDWVYVHACRYVCMYLCARMHCLPWSILWFSNKNKFNLLSKLTHSTYCYIHDVTIHIPLYIHAYAQTDTNLLSVVSRVTSKWSPPLL